MLKRESYAKIKESFDIPNLLEIQLKSYVDFLQKETPKTKRKNQGLESAFREIFPIESADGEYKLEYLSYSIGKPKYGIPECKKRGISYAGALRVMMRLKSKKETKEQEVYLGDIPLMTETGTFIVNGDERVVVSQLHRAPGISFETEIHPTGKKIYSARIIPYRGAWVEFEFDINDVLYVYIDRRRKFLATALMRAFGFSTDEQILKAFGGVDKHEITRRAQLEKLIGQTMAANVVDKENDVVIIEKNEKLTADIVEKIWNSSVRKVEVLRKSYPELSNTLKKDHTKNADDAVMDIYRKLRPGDPPTPESAHSLVQKLFFDTKRYDLGSVGRYMLNRKLGMKVSLDERLITPETLVQVMSKLIELKSGEGAVDDIDHLGNRRIRCVGELLLNQIRIGLVRVDRSCRERMNIYDLSNVMPHNLINAKLISSVIRDFFGRSQLSQFMDQTNPLAELTHKRRMSALGPGGLNRERAGFEVRDVHYSHYGRMCPIETPEGPNIGLISSLSTYARINDFGFIETPYRKVENSRVTDRIDYLSADVEDLYVIAQANAKLDARGHFVGDKVFCRFKDDFVQADPKDIQYMDVSPVQLVSVAASRIPFLEHDDANRALMGSNMQRQAVPLLDPESPLVGTGMEYRTAKDSGVVVVAKDSGNVTHVDSEEIVVSGKIYELSKFQRSNANTCINQRPIVKLGQKVREGDVIADGAATKEGELALGRNVLVAFM
ncbi:MAG: DNA-directed RNA polymerase subunit beta, partial [Candidatus Portnoybacteria bacterium]|nr:DNA-directed RNA polymerase subunit beta [Candidatus Portnoybacteria bacterium]